MTSSDQLYRSNQIAEIWYEVFFWAFISSIIIHFVAAGLAFSSLRRHKIARFWPILLIFAGIFTPIFVSLITSKWIISKSRLATNCAQQTGSAIAGVYRAASFRMEPTYALLFGVGQTLLILVFAYTRILATL